MVALGRWTLNEAAKVLGASSPLRDAVFTGVSTDTRTLRPGDLFVALKGPRFDAHDHIGQAAEKGAVGAIVSRQCDATLPYLLVSDTRIALGKLARAHRESFRQPVIGLTGSNGKTTVKELLTAILKTQGEVLATKGNYNNDIGVPLTLFDLKLTEKFAVIEMGANHAGEIAYLCGIAAPDVAILNNAGAAHLEGFGSLEGVARAKGEIFDTLPASGTAIINRDDNFADYWLGRTKHCRRIGFGIVNEAADVRARDITQTDSGMRFQIITPQGEAPMQINLLGRHNVMNALAATAAAVAVGVPLSDIQRGLGGFTSVHGRLEEVQGIKGARVFNDTYNANPSSLKAGIDVLAGFGGKRILVMGDMLEGGENSANAHAECGQYAKLKGIDALYGYGSFTINAVNAFGTAAMHYSNKNDLAADLAAVLDANTTVLVKGSRSMKMEDIVERIAVKNSGSLKESV